MFTIKHSVKFLGALSVLAAAAGLAFDDILVAGQPIDNGTIPEPASLALLVLGLAGLAGLGAMRRRKTA
ncbi:MAG: PEP-CTERM sorting domain-containing protein [Polaromonas sp.]|nr:PEP-CTERM sorting domain-containing protein [Polaromonas sp.]